MSKHKQTETPSKGQGDPPVTNTADYFTDHLNGRAYIPRRGSYGTTTIQVLPELTGKRWCDASLALVTALKPTAIRVVKGGYTLDSRPGRVTVKVVEYKDLLLINHITQEVNFELVVDHIQNGYDVQRKLEEYCRHCGEKIYCEISTEVVLYDPDEVSIDWYHTESGHPHCAGVGTAAEEDYVSAEPKEEPTTVYEPNPNVHYGDKHYFTFPKPKPEVTAEQLKTVAADIIGVAMQFGYEIKRIPSHCLPGTNLHKFMAGCMRNVQKLLLKAVCGRGADATHAKDCEDTAFDAAAQCVVELQDMQNDGLIMLHRLVPGCRPEQEEDA